VICNSSEYHRLRDAKTGDLPVDYHISPESPLESGFSEAMRLCWISLPAVSLHLRRLLLNAYY
jgi:hypothetical protein